MTDTLRFDSESNNPEFFWEEIRRIQSVLEADLLEIAQKENLFEEQLWRRTYIRTTFACIEGYSYSFGQLLLFYDWWAIDKKFEDGLRNIKRIKTKNGSEKIITAYLPLVQYVKLLFKAYSLASEIRPQISSNDKAWINFSDAVKVRNRIVHPKKSHDLFISDSEIDLIKWLAKWYITSVTKLLQNRISVDKKILENMDKTTNTIFK